MTSTDHDTSASLDRLDALERSLYALGYASTTIAFEGETIDPPKAAAGRGEALATLEELRHGIVCGDEMGGLLDSLDGAELDDTHAAEVRVMRRDRDDAIAVPASDQAAFARLTCEATDVWHRAKLEGDWGAFEPYLDRIVDAMRRMGRLVDPTRDPYDVWLDQFERGTSCSFYDRFFDQVKGCVIPLVAAVREQGWQPSGACLEGTFDEEAQWALARDLMELEGVDVDALTLARTEHPFTDAVASGHAFIASHVHATDVASNVFSMLHEGGHALYEQGVDPAYDYTCLRGGTSMGMHEAQSRFFENVVGRSDAFAGPLLQCMARRFPEQLGGVEAHDLWLAVNRVEPSLVRTEADELTYPLHVIVRYEIERLLFSGEATAADVPGLWAERYRDYLGVEVPDDTHGALQDTHWACGSLGYFPTYALGSAYAAQLKDAMVDQGVDFEGTVAEGRLAPVRDWLRDNVWRHGRSRDSARIIADACGAPFDASHYTRYLTEKFGDIYGL
jgi:carboxypeptidase Taq